MATFLFENTLFGPVIIRRLGISLGINLLPNDSKLCSFDCIYCECGWNPEKKIKGHLPGRAEVKSLLRQKLIEMRMASKLPDVLTFAGNGEPTLHPEFNGIIQDTLQLRDELSPNSRVAVLSNATMLHKADVVSALKVVDDNILKLDSGIPETIQLLNKPVGKFDLRKLVGHLQQFEGSLIIQTMFFKGTYEGKDFDNTSENEISSWIELLKEIRPRMVMIYTIARDTPAPDLDRIPLERLRSIAKRVEATTSITVQVNA